MTPGGSQPGSRGLGGAEHPAGAADPTQPRLMSRTRPWPRDRPMRAACRVRLHRAPIDPARTLGRRTPRRTSLGLLSRSGPRCKLARRDLERPPRPLHRSMQRRLPRSTREALGPWPKPEYANGVPSHVTYPEPDPANPHAPGVTNALWTDAARRATAPSAALEAAGNAVLAAGEAEM